MPFTPLGESCPARSDRSFKCARALDREVAPTVGGNSPNIPLDGPDDRFFLYEALSNGVGSVGSFIHDTPAIITEAPYSGVGTTAQA
jgi:hypothetical protein